jgi:hypothetical protein
MYHRYLRRVSASAAVLERGPEVPKGATLTAAPTAAALPHARHARRGIDLGFGDLGFGRLAG